MKQFQILLGTFFLIVIGFTVTGCNMGKTSDESRISMIQTVNPEPTAIEGTRKKDIEIAEEVKKEIQELPAIYDVAVIKGKEEILVAYKVEHMQRFHMKKIEKELNQKLEKKYPKEDFIVSSDFKVFIEAIELKDKMKDENFSGDDAEKRLQKIITLKKELT